jgi:putative hydrolase of the HAD superfamily
MKGSLPKAVLLDLDETILAYPTSSDECWQTVCHRFSGWIPAYPSMEVFDAIRAYRDWYWSDGERRYWGRLHLDVARHEIVRGALLQLGVDDSSLAQQIAQGYAIVREDGIQPFPGALEVLRRLRDHQVALALITNGPVEVQESKIQQHALTAFFDCILISGKLGFGKPEERIFHKALDHLQVRPCETWMIGDDLEWDVAASQRLGITGIWLDSSSKGLPSSSTVHPDRIIRSLKEFLP